MIYLMSLATIITTPHKRQKLPDGQELAIV
jgi:hypothetical protein